MRKQKTGRYGKKIVMNNSVYQGLLMLYVRQWHYLLGQKPTFSMCACAMPIFCYFFLLFFFFSSQSSMYFPPEQKTFIFTNVWLLSFLMYIFFSCKYSRPNIIILSVSTASAEGYIFPSHKRWTGYYRSCWSPCAGLIPCYCMSIKYSFFLKLIKPQF